MKSNTCYAPILLIAASFAGTPACSFSTEGLIASSDNRRIVPCHHKGRADASFIVAPVSVNSPSNIPSRLTRPIRSNRIPSPHLFTSVLPLENLDDDNMLPLLFRPPAGKPMAVLVDAYAPWCGPCKLIEPFLEDCAERHADKLSVIKYDVEGKKNKNLKVELLLQGVVVRGLPTLLLYNEGEFLATHTGAITKEGLEIWLDEHLFSAPLEGSNGDGIKGSSERKVIAENDNSTDEIAGNENGGKRGFISLSSQLGRDDYAL